MKLFSFRSTCLRCEVANQIIAKQKVEDPSIYVLFFFAALNACWFPLHALQQIREYFLISLDTVLSGWKLFLYLVLDYIIKNPTFNNYLLKVFLFFNYSDFFFIGTIQRNVFSQKPSSMPFRLNVIILEVK